MDQNTCTACFERASGVAGHASLSQTAALRLFSDLSQSGHFPVMCQKDNGRFHVCHDQRETSALGARVQRAA